MNNDEKKPEFQITWGVRFNWSYDYERDVLEVQLLGPHKALEENETVEMPLMGVGELIRNLDKLSDSN